MKKYDTDHLVKPEDVVCDGMYKAVYILPFTDDFEVDADKFFKEIHSRPKKLRIDLAFEIINAKDRSEFEEMVHELYLKGM
jgi:hypothetical protein